MRLKLGLAGLALLITAGCAVKTGGPPDIVVDRSVCSHCSMLISEPLYAAAYQAPGSEGRVFDDIGCLLDAVRSETSPGLRLWFRDASQGEWIEEPGAIFVASPEIRTPMGGGVIAYRDPIAAEQAAGRHHGVVVRSIRELRSRQGGKS
jgi:copper chaperone NosL